MGRGDKERGREGTIGTGCGIQRQKKEGRGGKMRGKHMDAETK